MPTPTRDILDALAAAERAQDATTVIGLYGDHLTGLLARLQAVERAVRGALEDPTPELYLERWAASFSDTLDAMERDGDGEPETAAAIEFMVWGFGVLQALLLLYREVQCGATGHDLDAGVRQVYDVYCWNIEQRPHDDAVPAARIARNMFTNPLRHLDAFFGMEIRDRQEELAGNAPADIWAD